MFAKDRLMSKEDALEFIKNAKTVQAVYDKKWRWFRQGDSQQTSIMLDFLMDIEYKSGTLVFIADDVNKFGAPGNRERNSDAG